MSRARMERALQNPEFQQKVKEIRAGHLRRAKDRLERQSVQISSRIAQLDEELPGTEPLPENTDTSGTDTSGTDTSGTDTSST